MITSMKFISLLLLLLTSQRAWVTAQGLTYHKDIRPIIQAKCAPCHHPGGGAPFSLETYADVAKRATFIKEVVESRYMPPWRADNQYVHFANDRSLEQRDINTLVQWISNKTPEGKPTGAAATKTAIQPAATKYNRAPDKVLKVTDSFLLTGDNMERFIVFKIPFEFSAEENVEAIEFYTNNNKLIHHANYAIHEVSDPAIDIHSTDKLVNLS